MLVISFIERIVMEFWMIYIIVAVIAIIIEILVPTMFCINFAFGGIITAIISIFWGNTASLIITFIAISLLSIILIKPLLTKMINKDSKADFNSQYIGKIVKCIEPISMTKGAITIYDERWEARTEFDCEEISVGSDVKIIKNDSLILFVEKI